MGTSITGKQLIEALDACVRNIPPRVLYLLEDIVRSINRDVTLYTLVGCQSSMAPIDGWCGATLTFYSVEEKRDRRVDISRFKHYDVVLYAHAPETWLLSWLLCTLFPISPVSTLNLGEPLIVALETYAQRGYLRTANFDVVAYFLWTYAEEPLRQFLYEILQAMENENKQALEKYYGKETA
jgi:hypothetical protein